MRIDPNVVVSPVASPTAERSTGTTNPPAAHKPDDRNAAVVVLSATAAKLGPEPAATTSSDRLERIRALLDAGEYPVDLDKLASRIVDDEILRSRKLP